MILRIVKILFVLFLVGVIAAGAFIFSIYAGAFGKIPTRRDLLEYKNKTASLVQASNGELIGKFFEQNRTNISFDQIPGHLVNALIATEDARFYQHQGIDSRSLLRVFVKSLLFRDPDAGGGSTISQQLVKNRYGRNDYGAISLPVNKIREAMMAKRLERNLTKEEILTLYLNTVTFGENLYGIESAARRYFNKPTQQLRIEESAVLVGLLKANTTYNPHLNPENSRMRRNVVLNQMVRYGYLAREEADSLSALPLVLDYANIESDGPADYFLPRVREEVQRILDGLVLTGTRAWKPEEDGLVIRTTLDIQLQRFALEAYREHLPVMQNRLKRQYQGSAGTQLLKAIHDTLDVSDVVLHAGLVALDARNGAVKCWVGGIGFQEYPYDQVLARRQLASAFKPVIYATALERGSRPCRYLDNKPVEVAGFEDWSPRNYDRSTGGKYSMAGALAHSMNVPTVHLYLELGFDPVEVLWNSLGFSFQLYESPSVALGTAEANALELAVAYAAFANGGYRVSPVAIESITAPDGKVLYRNPLMVADTRVISQETSMLMSAMLQKAVREGTGATMSGVYGVNYPWAGKTGTSQNYSDAWFGAFNPRLVLVTRVGASTPAIHFNHGSNGSGSALALPLIARTLRKMETNTATRADWITPFPALPEELAGALDCPDFREENFMDRVRSVLEPGREPERRDKTLAGPDTLKVQKKRKSIFDIFRRKKR